MIVLDPAVYEPVMLGASENGIRAKGERASSVTAEEQQWRNGGCGIGDPVTVVVAKTKSHEVLGNIQQLQG
jgi:hypothetical protein